MEENIQIATIKIHPSAIHQLGEQLISDEIQALIELVKNSYDADAKYVKIKIKTAIYDDKESKIPFANDNENVIASEIVIEDNGDGMSYNDIDTGWLHIANRAKLKQKIEKRLTKLGRTPLGDKGLGRLGVQRLGAHVEVYTKQENGKGYFFEVPWGKVISADKLEDITISVKELPNIKKGTSLKITQLNNPEIWTGEGAIKKLKNELSKMLSPYPKIRSSFIVYLDIDGTPIDLFEIQDNVRNSAHIKYSLSYRNKRLKIHASISKNWFLSKLNQKSDPKNEQFSSDLHFDQFLSSIKDQKISKQFRVKKHEDSNWFLQYKTVICIKNLDKIEYIKDNLLTVEQNTREKKIADPGNFEGEIDYFDFNNSGELSLAVSEYKKLIQSLGGIRIYRDGFGVRADQDWLNLGKGATSKTFWTIRPENTHGYISISALHNSQLEETTSRERLQDSIYYRNFYLILQQMIAFSDTTNNFFGKQWSEYRKQILEKQLSLELGNTESISRTIQTQIENIQKNEKTVALVNRDLKQVINSSKGIIGTIKSKEKITHEDISLIYELINRLAAHIEQADQVSQNLNKSFDQLNKLKDFAEVIEQRFEKVKEQQKEIFEAAALGLTAETLSHEIYNITDQILLRANGIQEKITSESLQIRAYNQYIISTALGLRKQISYIDPALKYIRDKKERINLKDLFVELQAVQINRLKSDNITLEIIDSSIDGIIYFNRGKLIQILDNLINNSVYWLKDYDKNNNKKIYFELKVNNCVNIWDTAKGIDPSVQHILFEPFVSTKYDKVTQTRGRGLGLYIIKQLLEYDNCSIKLLDEKNEFNRYFKFELNLQKVSNERIN